MKKLTALLTAVVMLISSTAMIVVNAAERTFKPWELYSVPWGVTDTEEMAKMSAYHVGGIQWFAKDETEAGKRGSLALLGAEFIPQVGQSETDAGTVAVGFVVPYDSIYTVEGQFTNYSDINFGIGVDVGKVDVYKLPKGETNLSSDYKLDVGDQMLHATGGRYYADPIEESYALKEGETLIFHTRTSDNNSPAIGCSIRIENLKITDENNSATSYDIFNILNVSPSYKIDKKVYHLKDYMNVSQYADNPWNMYFAKHTSVEPNITPANWISANDDSSKNDVGVNDVFDDYGHDYKIYHTNGGQIRYNSKGLVPIYALRATGDPDIPNNSYTNPVISWTAPHEGEWIVEFKVRNEWAGDEREGALSTHWLGYLDQDNNFQTMQVYNGPSVITCRDQEKYQSGAMDEYKFSIRTKAGEEICLVNQAASFFSYALIELKFTNANDTTEVYSSNNIGKSAITADNGGDSPFDLFGLINCETSDRSINDFMKKTIYGQDDVNIAIDMGYPMSINKSTGTLNVSSSDTGLREGLMFKFPDDGKYVMTLSAHNNTDANDGIIQHWYYDSDDYSGRMTTNNLIRFKEGDDLEVLGTNPVIHKVYDASAGDAVYLSFGTKNRPISYAFDITFEKIEEQSAFNFFADGYRVLTFADVAANAGKNLNLSYKFNNQGEETPFAILTAVYTKDGIMKSAAISEQMTAGANELVTGTVSMLLPQGDLTGGYMKTFVWRDINDITPLADAYPLN